MPVRNALPALTLTAATLLAGCSSNEMLRAPLDVSIGQQLIDLKEAHSRGALTDREYEQQRRQLIDSVRRGG